LADARGWPRVRAGGHPEAGGLVVAIDKEHAERLAYRLEEVSGECPEIVTSDARDASARIARFPTGRGSWLVSVLMVSEGVDIPRLRVGVYATAARTELFFRPGGRALRPPRPVAAISRRTGEPHRTIHARVNRATGAPSVSDATAEQLERGNGLLECEA
jgi:superfamily II DNA or RNA helicase